MVIGLLPIPNYSDYMADVDGSIWSSKQYGRWIKLKPYRRKSDGRARYKLVHDNGELHRKYGAYFILVTYVGPQPEGLECCHEDGDCTNDAKYNLRWDTKKNNQADRVKHGTDNCGERNGASKLTQEEIQEIISMREAGEKLIDIANDFDISLSRVSQIYRQYVIENSSLA